MLGHLFQQGRWVRVVEVPLLERLGHERRERLAATALRRIDVRGFPFRQLGDHPLLQGIGKLQRLDFRRGEIPIADGTDFSEFGSMDVGGVDATDSAIPLFGQPGIGRVVVPDQIVELRQVEARGDSVKRDDHDLGRNLLEPRHQAFGRYRVGKDLDARFRQMIPEDLLQDRSHVDLLRVAGIDQQPLSPVDHPLGDTDEFFFFGRQQLPVGKRQPVQGSEKNIPQLQFVVVMPERVADAQELGSADGRDGQKVFRRQVRLFDDAVDALMTGCHQLVRLALDDLPLHRWQVVEVVAVHVDEVGERVDQRRR